MPQLPKKRLLPTDAQRRLVTLAPVRPRREGDFKAPTPLNKTSRIDRTARASCWMERHAYGDLDREAARDGAVQAIRTTTSKTMKLDPDFDTIVTSVSDLTGSGEFCRFKSP